MTQTYTGAEGSITLGGLTFTKYTSTFEDIDGNNPAVDIMCPSGTFAVGGGGYFRNGSGQSVPLYQSVPITDASNPPNTGWRVTAKAQWPDEAVDYTAQVFVIGVSEA